MKPKFSLKLVLLGILLPGFIFVHGQDPNRFKEQVNNLSVKEYNFNSDKKLVLFVGSSSIRKWIDIQDYFPNYNIINNGFGGSQFSDLIYYYDELVTKHTPEILFIYEGDNDIAKGKKASKILKQAKGLFKRIHNDLPQTSIVLISPKPSLKRKHLKRKYIKYNKKLKKYCEKQDHLEFADVWSIMLDEKGNVFEDIFIEDRLHMNKKGYDLWAQVIREYLK